MNKLKTDFNGGFPLTLDDIRFIDEYFRTGIHQIAISLAKFAILSGFEPINNNTVSAGWLIINGEIGFIPETTGLDFNFDYGVVADNYLDSSVVRITQAGASIKPHEIRQFKLEPYHPSMGEDVSVENLQKLKDVLRSEFGLNGALKRKVIATNASPFSWNATNSRWESINAHGLGIGHHLIMGASVHISMNSNSVLVPLFSGFIYEIDATNIIIVDKSPNPSNDDLRRILEVSTMKIIFEHN